MKNQPAACVLCGPLCSFVTGTECHLEWLRGPWSLAPHCPTLQTGKRVAESGMRTERGALGTGDPRRQASQDGEVQVQWLLVRRKSRLQLRSPRHPEVGFVNSS